MRLVATIVFLVLLSPFLFAFQLLVNLYFHFQNLYESIGDHLGQLFAWIFLGMLAALVIKCYFDSKYFWLGLLPLSVVVYVWGMYYVGFFS